MRLRFSQQLCDHLDPVGWAMELGESDRIRSEEIPELILNNTALRLLDERYCAGMDNTS